MIWLVPSRISCVTYDVESAKGYTLGLKTTLLDGRLFLSAAAWYNELTDLQQSQ